MRLPVSTHLRLHVRPVLDVLVEVADVAANFLVGFKREGNHRDEAEGEPFPGACVSELEEREI